MPGIYVRNCDDLPYGPGQSDYEYDAWRDRRDEDAQQQLEDERRRADEEQLQPQGAVT